jgi:hypothetical protein
MWLLPFPLPPGHHGVTSMTLLWKMGPCRLLGWESWRWKPTMPLTSTETCELLTPSDCSSHCFNRNIPSESVTRPHSLPSHYCLRPSTTILHHNS